MRKTKIMETKISIGIVCVAMMVAILALPAEGRAQGFEMLKLSVAPEKTQIALGEPLVLKIGVMNPTDLPITAHRDLDTGYGMMDVRLARPEEGFRRFLGPGWGINDAQPLADQIGPGESLSMEIPILFHNAIPGRGDLHGSNMPLDEPGVYQIQVEWSNLGFEETITSLAAEVEVLEPMGNAMAMWLALRSDPELGYFLQTGDARKGLAAVRKAEQLVAQYPETIHAKYFALALGKSYLRGNDLSKAIEYLRPAAESSAKSYLRRQALLGLMKAYARNRDFDRALALCDAHARDFVESSAEQVFSRSCAEVKRIAR